MDILDYEKYLAEYVQEYFPEITDTLHFSSYLIRRYLEEFVVIMGKDLKTIAETFKNMFRGEE